MIPAVLKKLIKQAKAQKATDIHVCVGAPILFRIGRDLVPSTTGSVTSELSEQMVSELLSPTQARQFRKQMDFDLMIADEEGRYRVNVSFNDQLVGVVVRILPEQARSIDELKLPPIVKRLAGCTKGLILVTGSTSQGKSATMSGIINEINTHQRRHIITIEDPIENIHPNKMSIVRQREVNRDTQSFYSGLRAALRQDPDVIAIGEMRDYETIKIALTAAETGVLVLSTLHIISIDKLLERLLSYAPSEDQGHLRYLMAGALQGVIHQELIPTVDGDKRVACEVLITTDAVKNVIRVRDSFMLRNIIHTGGKHGMINMKQSIAALQEEGIITPEVAQSIAINY
ncbi:MAG: type IV pilus twitching motility protein PilT [Planctomycetota bacterium]|jgi:twitching motility protein PilT